MNDQQTTTQQGQINKRQLNKRQTIKANRCQENKRQRDKLNGIDELNFNFLDTDFFSIFIKDSKIVE